MEISWGLQLASNKNSLVLDLSAEEGGKTEENRDDMAPLVNMLLPHLSENT